MLTFPVGAEIHLNLYSQILYEAAQQPVECTCKSFVSVSFFQTLSIRHVNSNQCLDKPNPHDRDTPSVGKSVVTVAANDQINLVVFVTLLPYYMYYSEISLCDIGIRVKVSIHAALSVQKWVQNEEKQPYIEFFDDNLPCLSNLYYKQKAFIMRGGTIFD